MIPTNVMQGHHLSQKRFGQTLLSLLSIGGASHPRPTIQPQPSQHQQARKADSATFDTRELAERPEMQLVLDACAWRTNTPSWLRDTIPALPASLALVPDRISASSDLRAAGFFDRASRTVGVDIAYWYAPPSSVVSELAWRQVFDWVVASDRELHDLTILTSPTVNGCTVSASYRYDVSGVAGFGILHVSALPNAAWRIIDCSADACETRRVEALAHSICHQLPS